MTQDLNIKQSAIRPAEYETKHIIAIQALLIGEASPDQQKLALDWIINEASNCYELSYRPGDAQGDRETCFAEGRRFVGMQIVKLTKLRVTLSNNK